MTGNNVSSILSTNTLVSLQVALLVARGSSEKKAISILDRDGFFAMGICRSLNLLF
jgi:hypothetical protein